MKQYRGRRRPYTHAEYVAAGFSPELAEQYTRSHPPVREKNVIVVDTGEREYEIVLVADDLHEPILEWGYNGAGPLNAARSILSDVFDATLGLELDFEREIVANLPRDSFDLTEESIRAWADARRT